MRGHVQNFNVFTNKALTMSGLSTFSSEFPLGEGWFVLWLHFVITLTNTTGTTVISEAELSLIKNIMFKTDRDGISYNIPARALWYLNYLLCGTVGTKTTASATAGTFKVTLPIIFANPRLVRPVDTILDTRRYNMVELHITMGSIADWLSTVGDGALTATLTAEVQRTYGTIPKGGEPVAYPYVASYPQVNPASATKIDIERSTDLALLLALIHSGNSVTSGVGFSGTGANTTLADISIEDNEGYVHYKRPIQLIQDQAKQMFELETYNITGAAALNPLTGWHPLFLSAEGSLIGAYPTGGKSRCEINWTNGTLSTSGVTALIQGVRQLK